MKTLIQILTVLAIVWGATALERKCDTVTGVLFFLPFALGPLFVTFALAFFCDRTVALWLLLLSAEGYLFWFFYVYLDVFYWHPDPQSTAALLFVGVHSLPLMLPLWAAAWWKRRHKDLESTYD